MSLMLSSRVYWEILTSRYVLSLLTASKGFCPPPKVKIAGIELVS